MIREAQEQEREKILAAHLDAFGANEGHQHLWIE